MDIAEKTKTTKENEKLAYFGGQPLITGVFKRYNSIGYEEIEAVKKTIESGVLSQFVGAWSEDFYGGPNVREFEEKCKDFFSVNHAITFNSLTSGLIGAVGALEIEPGEEVIVSPWTMSATATSILHWNGIPVFADIESSTFCLDPTSVEANISPYTKAIIATDIFGHSANISELTRIASKYNLKLISDAAQAPGALYKNKMAGTLADIGGFSLNYHKHIHTGEGGIMVTNDDELAERMRLIRNHAEAVVGPKGTLNLSNMIGHNFRLGEIECAIGIEQLKKLNKQVKTRQEVAEKLTKGLKGLIGLKTPIVEKECSHVYYIYPIILDTDLINVSRDKIYQALKAEGLTCIIQGYQNIHRFPIYQKKIAYGSKGFPWTSDICQRDINYNKGICPIAEELHDCTFLGLTICAYEFSDIEIEMVISVFKKVWANMQYFK